MILGKVIGTVVSTKKDEKLVGFKLLVIQPVGIDMKPKNDYVVAVDTVGAGFHETVMVVSGSSARQTSKTDKKPVDAAVVGIIDTVSFKEV